MALRKFYALKINLAIEFTQLECIGKAVMMLYFGYKQNDKSNISTYSQL